MPVAELPVQELKRRLDAGEPLQLIDVREAWEYEIAHVNGSVLIPMADVPARLAELKPDADTVVMCHSGGRSRRVAAYLASQGFDRIANLTGGIDAWSRDIDPSVPTY